jgi:hypothetical protein
MHLKCVYWMLLSLDVQRYMYGIAKCLNGVSGNHDASTGKQVWRAVCVIVAAAIVLMLEWLRVSLRCVVSGVRVVVGVGMG